MQQTSYPRIYVPMNVKQSNELSNIVMQQTSNPWIYVPTNQEYFVDNLRTLAPTNKSTSDSTVHVHALNR